VRLVLLIWELWLPTLMSAMGGKRTSALSPECLLPRRYSRPVAAWLPRVELGAGLLLFLGVALVPVAFFIALLLLVLSGVVGINLLRGREMSCNCFGASTPEKMTWLTVGRNIVLVGMASSVVLIPPTALSVWPRPGGPAVSQVTPGAATAMFLASSSVALLVGLVSQALRIARSERVLKQHVSVEGRERA
jgi:hypothetical protein